MENRTVTVVLVFVVTILLTCVLLMSIIVGENFFQSQESVKEVWEGGDGLGFNLKIEFVGTTYRATWHGCLGEYGRAEGDFIKAASQIRFNPKTETGMMINRFRSMRIVQNEGQEYLIDEDEKNAMEHLPYSGLKKLIEVK